MARHLNLWCVRHWNGGILLLTAALLSAASAVGEDQAKRREYRFSHAPLEIFDRLPTLKVAELPSLPPEERRLLEKAWAMRAANREAGDLEVDEEFLWETLLWASGVESPETRRKYRERFDALLVKAEAALLDLKDERQRGERLMKLLHEEVMKGGYKEDQTSLAAIFDTGKFNCVSSAAMYYAVGTRAKLKLIPFSIPGNEVIAGHASLDLLVGNERLQVEPTNPDGFDWKAKINQPGVRVIGFVPDRKDGHPSDALGLAASIYSNRGVALIKGTKSPRPWDAARCYLSALALDPADEGANNNLLTIFVNAGHDLIEERKFEEALAILAFGLSIAPQAKDLHANQTAAWSEYIMATLDSGKPKDAIELVRRAAQTEPKHRDFRSSITWLTRHGQKVADEQGFDAALNLVPQWQELLDAKEQQELLQWRSSLFRQWSESLLAQEDADGSLKVLARAYRLDKQDKEIHEGVGYHTHKAVKFLERTSGLPAAIAHAQALYKEFSAVKGVGENCQAIAQSAVLDLAEKGKFEEAVAAAKRYQPLLADKPAQIALGAGAYDLWAQHFAEEKKFEQALDKYAEGLKAFPGDKRVMGNAEITVEQWAAPEVAAQQWDSAIGIYEKGLEVLPGSKKLQRGKEVCQRAKEGAM